MYCKERGGRWPSAKARKASIYKARRFSDHAPLIIDYDYELESAKDPAS